MNDYSYLLKEFQDLKFDYMNQKNDIDKLMKYFQSFASIISLFHKSCCINKDDILKDESFHFFIKLYQNLIEDIKNTFVSEMIKIPLNKLKENYNSNEDSIFKDYEAMEKDLFDGKEKLNNAKKEYSEYVKEKKEIEKNYKNLAAEGSILFEAKKQNLLILYQYELNRMNETIDKNNIIYNKIRNKLDSINMNKENVFKNAILDFAKMIGKIGNKFVEFEKNIKISIQTLFNKNIIINNEIKMKFPKEVNEFNEIPKVKKDNNIIDDFLIIETPGNVKNEDNIKINNKLNYKINDNNDSNEVVVAENKKYSKKEKLINEIIKNLIKEEEIPSTEIYELLEIIKSEELDSSFFFENFKNYYKHRVIICKNKHNFIHLTNIFNDLIIKRNYNYRILNEIIEVSQMIKYKDIYMTSMIQKNNNIFSNKTFWIYIFIK